MAMKDAFLNKVRIGNRVELVIESKAIEGIIVALDLDSVRIHKDDGEEQVISLELVSYYEISESEIISVPTINAPPVNRGIVLPDGRKMFIEYYEEICGLMKRLAGLLELEYSMVSELLERIDHLSNVENIRTTYVESIRSMYYEKLGQISQLIKMNNDFIMFLEDEVSALRHTSDGLNSVFSMTVTETADQRNQEKESFIAVSDSLEVKDDDDASAVANAKAIAADIATSISETSMYVYVPNQEKRDLRRKQIADTSTSDAIATLRAQLAGGGETMVNTDRTIYNPPDSSAQGEVCDGFKPVDWAFVPGDNMSGGDIIQVPDRKQGGRYGVCRICGTVFNQMSNYCPECGTKVMIEKPAVRLDKVQFSAVAPKTFVKGDYSVIEILMYEEDFRHVVQEALVNEDGPVKETKSGVLTAEREAEITVKLYSPDFEIADNTESQIWQGGYLDFSFAVEVPEQYKKRQILFVASVYINDIIATRLKFVAKCKPSIEQKIEVTREDILSAFVSYASQDRNRVAMIIQGMKKARPDMDIFFDVDSLRSGDDWEKALWREIDKRDVFFLCWSKYARDSKWVDAEWRYALKNKGADSIEPVPIDSPESCPPPDELSCKHFNDRLLYIIKSKVNPEINGN